MSEERDASLTEEFRKRHLLLLGDELIVELNTTSGALMISRNGKELLGHAALPTSYFLRPTSYLLPPTSHLLFPTSYFLLPTSLLPTSYFLLPTSCFLPAGKELLGHADVWSLWDDQFDASVHGFVVAIGGHNASSFRIVHDTPVPPERAPVDPHRDGLLRVHLNHAIGLMAAPSFAKTDPYVVVRSGGLEKQSKPVKDSLSPQWKEAIDLPGTLASFLLTGGCIHVHIHMHMHIHMHIRMHIRVHMHVHITGTLASFLLTGVRLDIMHRSYVLEVHTWLLSITALTALTLLSFCPSLLL